MNDLTNEAVNDKFNQQRDANSNSATGTSVTKHSTANEQEPTKNRKRKYIPAPDQATNLKTGATLDASSPTVQTPPVYDARNDPRGVYQIQKRVEQLVTTWGAVAPVHPQHFLQRIMESRGYDATMIPAMTYRIPPYPRQVHDYDNELVWAVRNSDLAHIISLAQSGRCMSACNRFSESIVHVACRRSDLDIVSFILSHGGDVNLIDDSGRTPLHDACWRTDPRFDIVTMLLDLNPNLVRYGDARGNGPLWYVRDEHWINWCAFLYYQRDRYWINRKQQNSSSQAAAAAAAAGRVSCSAEIFP
mmetsp:Transcript_25396/g.42556  ORF Transcript_25396/g.42556 Transcript_25396/m.42556 type:complete len:303 (-) Transcript_25396:191-1099(-)